jgi:hypothetical protein
MSKKTTVIPEHDMLSANSKTQSLLNKANKIFESLDNKNTEPEENIEAPQEEVHETLKPLKDLLFLGSLRKETTIGGFKFVLKTPSNSQNREVAKKIFLLPESDRFIDGNTYQLSNYIESINGYNVFEIYEHIYGEKSDLSKIETGFKLLSDMDAQVVGRLLDVFLELADENKKIAMSGDLPKNIKK